MSERIYLSDPHMGEDEQALVAEAFASNWLSTVGPHLDAFEAEMGERLGRHAVALASGTAAIHIGLRLLGVRPGDEVVCPTLTFVASANPILYLGARPIFVDSERSTWNLDPNLLEDLLRERARVGRLPRAVIVVHLYGQCAKMDALESVCARYGVPILEDAAEALGASYRDRPAGALAPLAALSFNGNKIITTTGGGMLLAEREEDARRARHWATQAREPDLAYTHSELGYNYRLSNVLAAIGRGQLRVLDERVAARRGNFARYVEALADLHGLEPMPEAPEGRHTRWLSTFLVDSDRLGIGRDALLAALAERNIEARPVWKPMHLQPLYRDAERVGGAIAEDLFHRGMCLPSSSRLTDAMLTRVIEVLRDGVARARAKRRIACSAG